MEATLKSEIWCRSRGKVYWILSPHRKAGTVNDRSSQIAKMSIGTTLCRLSALGLFQTRTRPNEYRLIGGAQRQFESFKITHGVAVAWAPSWLLL